MTKQNKDDFKAVLEAISMIDSVKAAKLQKKYDGKSITEGDVNDVYKELMHSKWLISYKKRQDWRKLKDYLEYDIYG